jgi:hypothetical protein
VIAREKIELDSVFDWSRFDDARLRPVTGATLKPAPLKPATLNPATPRLAALKPMDLKPVALKSAATPRLTVKIPPFNPAPVHFAPINPTPPSNAVQAGTQGSSGEAQGETKQQRSDLDVRNQTLESELQRMYKHLTQFCPQSFEIPQSLVDLYLGLDLPIVQADRGALNQGALNQGALGQSALNQGALGQGALNQGALGQGALNQGALGQGALNQGALGQSALNQGALDRNAARPVNAVRLRDFRANTDRLVMFLTPVHTIGFTADNNYLVVGSTEKCVNCIDLQRMATLPTIPVSETACVLLPVAESTILVGCRDGAIYLMEIGSASSFRPLLPAPNRVIVAMRLLKVRNSQFLLTLYAGTLRVSEFRQGRLGRFIDLVVPSSSTGLAVGTSLATVYGPTSVHVFSVAKNGIVTSVTSFAPANRVIFAMPITARRTLVLSSSSAEIFDLDTERLEFVCLFPVALVSAGTNGSGYSLNALFGNGCPAQIGPFRRVMQSPKFDATVHALSNNDGMCAGFVPRGADVQPVQPVPSNASNVFAVYSYAGPEQPGKRRMEDSPPEEKRDKRRMTNEGKRVTRASSKRPLLPTS